MNWDGMYSDRYAVARVKKAVDMLIPHLSDKDVVLDVGCFTQEAKKYLPDNITYIGIDSKAYVHNTAVRDLDKGFTKKCDAVICLEVLEHLKHPVYVLKCIAYSVKPDGYVVISLPNEATLFHRLRCLFGVVDAECFSDSGKHLHLPNIVQCRKFLEKFFVIHKESYYINPGAKGSRQAWLGFLLRLIPDTVWQVLANLFPSLFARGFIFLLKKRIIPRISSIKE